MVGNGGHDVWSWWIQSRLRSFQVQNMDEFSAIKVFRRLICRVNLSFHSRAIVRLSWFSYLHQELYIKINNSHWPRNLSMVCGLEPLVVQRVFFWHFEQTMNTNYSKAECRNAHVANQQDEIHPFFFGDSKDLRIMNGSQWW